MNTLEQFKALPSWAVRVTDGEVLAMISIDMGHLVYGCNLIEVEDSRSLQLLMFDAAVYFCKLHEDTEWGDGSFMFTEEVIKLEDALTRALAAEPNWINDQYRAMFGKETIEDLLARNTDAPEWKPRGSREILKSIVADVEAMRCEVPPDHEVNSPEESEGWFGPFEDCHLDTESYTGASARWPNLSILAREASNLLKEEA